MSDREPGLSCYLVEWYPAELSAEVLDRTLAQLHQGTESMSADGSSAKVLMTLAVPTDEVIFCVFLASSTEVVCQVCERAGLPAERVTAAMTASVA
jgi:uncharacterized protein DUF4242